jgi:NAD(P)H dehydrogenase (quinone)
MRVLVVFCHPRRASFTGDVLDRVVAGLGEAGHAVDVADLYREGFQPVFGDEDYAQFEGGAMGADVLREQERVERSDGIVLVFPVWWWSFPAMLKGWFDRVWACSPRARSASSRARRPRARCTSVAATRRC